MRSGTRPRNPIPFRSELSTNLARARDLTFDASPPVGSSEAEGGISQSHLWRKIRVLPVQLQSQSASLLIGVVTGMDSNHDLDRILKFRKLLNLQRH
jgi:hypothetical protein